MARQISGSLNITLQINDVNDNGLSQEKLPIALTYTQEFKAGAGGSDPAEIDEIYQAKRTLAGGANEELDLAGALVGDFGQTVTFAKIKLIYIELEKPATNPPSGLNVGGAAVNAFINWVANATDVLKIQAGGVLCLLSKLAAGYAVTAGTGDKLKIENADGANAATYKIVILGNK